MISKILIISLAGIGDTITSTPTIKAIRKKYSKAKIDLLTFPYGNKEVLDGSKYIDDTYIFVDKVHTPTSKKPPFSKLIKTLFLLIKLRFKGYDLSVSVHPSSSSKLALIAKFIGAKKRVGFDSKYYTHAVKLNEKLHVVDRNIQLLESLGIKIKDKKQYFYISKENEDFAEEVLKNKGNLFVGMHPGGYWKRQEKKWGIERFGKLADKLNREFGARIIVFEGPSEVSDGEKMSEYMKVPPIIIKTGLKNAAAIIKKCKLFISNNTGLMHIAEAVNTPVIDILGWAYFHYSVYYEENKKLIAYKYLPCHEVNCPMLKGGPVTCNFECYTKISVNYVFNIAKKVLNKNHL